MLILSCRSGKSIFIFLDYSKICSDTPIAWLFAINTQGSLAIMRSELE